MQLRIVAISSFSIPARSHLPYSMARSSHVAPSARRVKCSAISGSRASPTWECTLDPHYYSGSATIAVRTGFNSTYRHTISA